MRTARLGSCLLLSLLAAAQQPVDSGYSAKIRQYTTEPYFLTELVDHVPASAAVPTVEKVLGYVAGAPDRLTYAKDVHRYLRALEQASPRVKTRTLGASEEGRETLLVMISDEANLARLDRLKEITARLADPRKITEAESRALIAEGLPIYWITGSLHSTETGSPEMLMELAYRLAVGETPLLQNIRKNAVVLITPVIDVDGRERMVDLYNWRKANPGKAAPSLIYWGKYVAHDNNRDGMALSLKLSQMVMSGFFEFHPQVLHDLHESVPYLYVSTGMGPYNAWLDPIVVNEWQKLAYHEVEEMTKRGVPGVWTHGFYDGWAANYMFMAAQAHNAIGRFYETFGNGGADTRERTLGAAQTGRTWYRPNPPLEKVRWSIRNNVNLQQSALLLALNYVATNKETFLGNFYLKSKRSVEKAAKEGPAAWVIPANDPRPGAVAEMVNLLRRHGVEVHRLDRTEGKTAEGSFVIRMDQPYSRLGDMLLDTQYYNPADTRPYDDTGWTFGALKNVRTERVTDPALLRAPMTLVSEDWRPPSRMIGAPATAAAFVIAHNADNELMQFRMRLRDVKMQAAEEAFTAGGREFPAGSFIIPMNANPNAARARIETEAKSLALTVHALDALPKAAAHPLAAPRIALVHTWINTQNEGWYRIALDQLEIPYDYISDHVLRGTADLRAKWDVILFGPVNATAQRIVNGVPRRGDPIPWKQSALTPNFGTGPDQTDDIRGGLGLEGVQNIARFVEAGGLFITITGNASLPIDYGLIEGVSIQQTRELNARGSILSTQFVDKRSPVAYGYGDTLAVYFSQAPVFQVSPLGVPGIGGGEPAGRPSGRGTATDPDIPQGRPYVAPEPRPQTRPGEDPPLPADLREQMRAYILPEDQRPRVILRFGPERDLLVSGMMAGARELAYRPAVIDVPRGQGHYLLFANNPMWRQGTQGSYFLLFNAMLNFDHLHAGRAASVRRN